MEEQKSNYHNNLSPSEILDIWQHFENVGRQDKDRMVSILAFLFPFLMSTIILTVKDGNNFWAIVGFFTSLIAIVVVLMYGGYANRNWRQADRIAENYLSNVTLLGLDKKQETVANELKLKGHYNETRLGFWAKKAADLSRPHDPQVSLARIFQLFLYTLIIALLVNLVLIVIF